MDNSKKSVHSSGALGVLLKSGQIKKIDETDQAVTERERPTFAPSLGLSQYKTQSGLEFSEQELMYVDPKECEPWKYANRHEDELGDIDELVESIRTSKQLQPGLVRKHPSPHDGIQYEIIFGRRRHIACLKLGIPFLVILKDLPNVQDAIAAQDAENKLRNDVSNYSNAVLYSRLISDGIFKNEKELADKLRISSSTFNDLMAFSKIPQNIAKKIPNIHNLSKLLAVKIIQLLNKDKENYVKLEDVASQIGVTLNSQGKLERAIESSTVKAKFSGDHEIASKTYKGKNGHKLFTFKADGRGLPIIVFDKAISNRIDHEKLCNHLLNYIERIGN